MKRWLDVAFTSAALVVAGPLVLALAAAVKLDSPGPALFRQVRVGRDRKPIRIAKLRTMAVRSEHAGPAVTAADDPRVTRVGAWLRKTKLDELPQLWNVLRGDMSIVGPRPEVPQYVERYRPEWAPLFTVRPGLTDLASITFRHEERLLAEAHDRDRAYTDVVMPMKLELAIAGLTKSSTLDDLAMIVRTVLAIVRPRDPATDPVIQEAARRIKELNRS